MSSLKRAFSKTTIVLACIGFCLISSTGCRNLAYWLRNDLKVGPNYAEPAASVAEKFDHEDSPLIDSSSVIDSKWWTVFNDPALNELVEYVLQENLTLKSAAGRIEEARAIRNISAANLFPQSQAITGDFLHTQQSTEADGFFSFAPITIRNWSNGFDASWEIDLWGKIRRNIAAAEASLEANVKDYDFVVVTLIGEVASLYINIVSLEERLDLAKKNVTLLEGSLQVAEKRFKAGRTDKLDVVQAKSNLAATQAIVPQLELAQRQALNALAVLMAIPPSQAASFFETIGTIPEIPATAIVGIPAELLMRRPDIRAAERQLAAQFENIGIAESEFYPSFTVNGTLGYQAAQFSDLLQTSSFNGAIGPGFRWNFLNYGRLLSAVDVEEARVQQLLFDFKNKVLDAQREVEDGIVEFIKNSERYEFDKDNAAAIEESRDLSTAQYKEGKTDFGRVFVVESNLVQVQDQLVQTKANIALGLIAIYKALGGGWEAVEQVQPIESFREAPSLEPTPALQNPTPRNPTSRDAAPRDAAPRGNRSERLRRIAANRKAIARKTVTYEPAQRR